MQMTRSEAFAFFKKWRSEQTPLRCGVTFPLVAVSISGRITEVRGDGLSVLSDDRLSEMSLSLPKSLDFAYEEPRDFPEEARRLGSGLVAVFPDPRDFLYFSEVKRES